MNDDTKLILGFIILLMIVAILGFSTMMHWNYLDYKTKMQLVTAGYFEDRDGVIKKIEVK